MKGKWYLVYTYTGLATREVPNGITDAEVALEASNEEDAIAEGKKKWKGIVTQGLAEWKRQKEKWLNPPATPKVYGPRNPRVVYKILLSE